MIDAAFLIAITAFFKEQLGLQGRSVLVAAFLVGLALFLSPQIIAALPAAGPWLEGVVNFIKLYLAACGSVDFVAALARKVGK